MRCQAGLLNDITTHRNWETSQTVEIKKTKFLRCIGSPVYDWNWLRNEDEKRMLLAKFRTKTSHPSQVLSVSLSSCLLTFSPLLLFSSSPLLVTSLLIPYIFPHYSLVVPNPQLGMFMGRRIKGSGLVSFLRNLFIYENFEYTKKDWMS
jgi:hypothetical protein